MIAIRLHNGSHPNRYPHHWLPYISLFVNSHPGIAKQPKMVLYLSQNITVKSMDDGCNLATSGTASHGFCALVSPPITRCTTPQAVPVPFLPQARRREMWEGGQNSARLKAISTDTHSYLKRAKKAGSVPGWMTSMAPQSLQRCANEPFECRRMGTMRAAEAVRLNLKDSKNRVIAKEMLLPHFEGCRCFCYLIIR